MNSSISFNDNGINYEIDGFYYDFLPEIPVLSMHSGLKVDIHMGLLPRSRRVNNFERYLNEPSIEDKQKIIEQIKNISVLMINNDLLEYIHTVNGLNLSKKEKTLATKKVKEFVRNVSVDDISVNDDIVSMVRRKSILYCNEIKLNCERFNDKKEVLQTVGLWCKSLLLLSGKNINEKTNHETCKRKYNVDLLSAKSAWDKRIDIIDTSGKIQSLYYNKTIYSTYDARNKVNKNSILIKTNNYYSVKMYAYILLFCLVNYKKNINEVTLTRVDCFECKINHKDFVMQFYRISAS